VALSEAARLFSGSLESVPALIGKQAEELRGALRAREKLAGRLAEYMARELRQSAPEEHGWKIVRQIFPAEDQALAKAVAHAVAAQAAAVAFLGVKGKPTALYFAQSAGRAADMGSILRQTVAKWGGKGGGAPDFAQGGGLDEDKLEDALAFAASMLPEG
jgi:alanyl-tRNA synthetase